MTRKARLWVGVTLLVVLGFNYGAVGFPLMGKSASIKDNYKAILIKQAKSGRMLKNEADEYMLEIFRKEKSAIDRKLLLLNCAALSLAIIIGSWTVFGLILHKGKR